MHLLEWMNFQNIHVEVQFLCSSCIWNFWFPGSIFIWKLSLPSYLFCGFLYLPPKSHCPSQVSCWKLRKPIPTQQRQAGCLGKQPASHRVTNSAGLFPWLNALLSQSWNSKTSVNLCFVADIWRSNEACVWAGKSDAMSTSLFLTAPFSHTLCGAPSAHNFNDPTGTRSSRKPKISTR